MTCAGQAGPTRLIVIAHRGASGYRPEHTLEAYRLAIGQGADFIEPDLVATKDGVLVARHENEISATTDVASRPEFAGLRTSKVVNGRRVSGWFTEDFTLAELKTLRAKERLPRLRPGNTRYDGLCGIPTFAEVVRLAKAGGQDGRPVGVYPETKLPTYFAHEGRRVDGAPIGIDLGRKVVDTLVAEGFTDPRRVYIQSFEVANLIALKKAIMPAAGVDLPLVQLFGDLRSTAPYDFQWNLANGADMAAVYGGLDRAIGGIAAATRYRALATGPALRWMKANYAHGLGPWKGNLLPRGTRMAEAGTARGGDAHADTRKPLQPHPMLARALDAGLAVHPYTLRAEEAGVTVGAEDRQPPVVAEAMQLYALGVEGFFIDQPDLGVAARTLFVESSRP